MALQKSIKFIRTTAIGGLLVIVPISVVLFVLGQLVYQLYDFGLALVADDRVPDVVADNPIVILAAAFGVILGVCFLTGLIVRTQLGNAAREWFNTKVAGRIPMYKALTSLTERFAGIEGKQFTPVEVEIHSTGIMSIGFLIEELPDGRATVFIPTAPMATVGNLYVVPAEKLRRLDASVNQTIATVTQWGVESRTLFETENAG